MLYLQSSLALAFILGLMWIAFRLFRRFEGRLPGLSRPRRIQVVERASLGERRSLLLVSVGEEQFLVGSTPQSLSLLAAIGSDSNQEEEQPQASSRPAPVQPFRSVLEESAL